MADELVVSLKAMARKYGTNPRQLQTWIRKKGFPAFRIDNTGSWRVRHSKAMEWFAKHEPNEPCQ